MEFSSGTSARNIKWYECQKYQVVRVPEKPYGDVRALFVNCAWLTYSGQMFVNHLHCDHIRHYSTPPNG